MASDGALALGQPVGVGHQRREIVRAGGLERDRRVGLAAAGHRRAAHHEPGIGSRAHTRPGARRVAPRPAGHGGHDRRLRAVARQLVQPMIGRRVGHENRVVRRQQGEPGMALGLRGQRGIEHRPPQPIGQVAGQRRHELDLGGRERRAFVAALQRQRAPGGRVAHQHGAQLVAEPVRPAELAMANAAVEVAVRGLAQARGPLPGGDEILERVHVAGLELAPRQAGPRVLGQRVLRHLARGQARGGIEREHADAVERHRAVQHPRRLERELAHVVAALGERGQVAAQPSRGHAASGFSWTSRSHAVASSGASCG
jgi:hypothetical protein